MAITVTTLQGSSAISADRITINDNFSTTVDSINNLLGILDTVTGKFDNTGVGANSVIVTEGLTVTIDGINVTSGNIGVDAGNIILNGSNSYIQIGGQNAKLAEKTLAKVSSGTFSAFDFSVGFNLAKLPKLTTAQIVDINISNLTGGEFVYDSTINKIKYYNTTTWVAI